MPEGVFRDGKGNTERVPFLRVFTNLRIGEQARYVCDAIMDSASPLTVFPRHHWERFVDDVEWLTAVSEPGQASWLNLISGRTGGRGACRLGRVSVAAFDLSHPIQFLSVVRVLALFEEERRGDDRILVGLHGSILQGRRSVVDPDGREGWLEDR
jgi:hypothetical protein